MTLSSEGAGKAGSVGTPAAIAAPRPEVASRPSLRDAPPKFTQGSILRHTLVMTGTGAVGALSIFAVDLLSLLYVSWLGRTDLKAAVGFATQVMLYPIAINIGFSIAVTAAVSRALGAGNRADARRIAASGLVLAAAVSTVVAAVALGFSAPLLDLFGARGETFAIAHRYLWITLPANVAFGLGMALSGLLRAVGDARRAMMVTLLGALSTAVLDPLLIFGLGFGIYGAAVATVVSRLVLFGVGLQGASRVHGLIARPRLADVLRHRAVILGVALPAVMTNLATPVGNGYALRIYAHYGDAAVAASVMIDRVVYVAFAVVFALTGAVGPIIGQNLGAGLVERVRATLTSSFLVTALYSVATWGLLAASWPLIARLFQATPETADYLAFFCTWGVVAWLFIGTLFVANAVFNNLGFPLLSMLFNWGRATLGTMPFVTLGAAWGGVKGGQLGMAFGAALFGTAALSTAYRVVARIGRRTV